MDLESAEKIQIDIEKLERNLKQVSSIEFVGEEKEVYDRAVDYKNDSIYYLEKKDMRTFKNKKRRATSRGERGNETRGT